MARLCPRSALVFCAAVLFAALLPDALALAAEGGYLSGYAEPDPRPTGISWWSTLAYLLSLLAVFVFVLVLAYFASRFIAGRFAQSTGASGGHLLAHLPLGPNRSICVAELAERVFVLGVTEHSITLLREITDAEEIERLHRSSLAVSGGMDIFSSQMGSLEQLAKRIPSLFRDGGYRR
ncbi:MAG: flagellar biosynthetic protein FliO [Selenomonadaceae bacterium]|jgi:flagellar protein FliO/FliZ|nr:flagellar biosynthetic protein FliO [Selenomonadaceae bacterium]